MKNLVAMGMIFLFGATTGATIALLNAPRSGEKTREKIRDGFNETRSRTEDAFSNVQARAKGTLEDLQNQAQKIADELGNKVHPTAAKLEAAAVAAK